MNFTKKIFTLIIIGFLVHIAFIYYFPYFKVWMISQNSEATNSVNVAFYRNIPTANSRDVIRPSPDLMYSGCGYDVTYDPLVINTDIPSSYWSVSFFSDNSDNFTTINNDQISEGNMTIYLFGPNSKPSQISNGYVVISPSNRGLMLIRQFIGNSSNLDELYEIQSSLDCKTLGN
tara:strand:+ start:1149 stop:1673 length:525 start_codon:yes stop_codon:yes gene_type:complete